MADMDLPAFESYLSKAQTQIKETQKILENLKKVDALLAILIITSKNSAVNEAIPLYIDLKAKLSALLNCDGPDKSCANLPEILQAAQNIVDNKEKINKAFDDITGVLKSMCPDLAPETPEKEKH